MGAKKKFIAKQSKWINFMIVVLTVGVMFISMGSFCRPRGGGGSGGSGSGSSGDDWPIISDLSRGDDVPNAIVVDASYIYVAGYDETWGNDEQQWRIEKRDKTTGELVPGFGVKR